MNHRQLLPANFQKSTFFLFFCFCKILHLVWNIRHVNHDVRKRFMRFVKLKILRQCKWFADWFAGDSYCNSASVVLTCGKYRSDIAFLTFVLKNFSLLKLHFNHITLEIDCHIRTKLPEIQHALKNPGFLLKHTKTWLLFLNDLRHRVHVNNLHVWWEDGCFDLTPNECIN